MTEQEIRPLAYLETRIQDRAEAYKAADELASALEQVHIARHLRPTVHALAATLASYIVLVAQELRSATINAGNELETEQLESATRHIDAYQGHHEHHRDAAKLCALQLARVAVSGADEEGLQSIAPIFATTVSNAFAAVAGIFSIPS